MKGEGGRKGQIILEGCCEKGTRRREEGGGSLFKV